MEANNLFNQEPPKPVNVESMPRIIAVREVMKRLNRTKLLSVIGLASTFVLLILNVLGTLYASIGAVLVCCAYGYFLFDVQKEQKYLEVKYNLKE
jgi:hypothetical protein